MQVKIHDLLLLQDLIITTSTNSKDAIVTPIYKGNDFFVTSIKDLLGRTYGAYGHQINPDKTTNLDLLTAIKKLDTSRYQVECNIDYKVFGLTGDRKS